MPEIKLPKEVMLDILNGDSDDGELIKDKIYDTTRWSELHEIVFKYKDKFYLATYSKGLTEYQNEYPWDYDNEVECAEVVQKEVVVKKWVKA
jgi:hypothetical protein